jgi:hypothetical protein
MAFSRLPSPGTDYGPCAPECSHVDCAETRRQAAQLCPRCLNPIGYENNFMRDSSGRLMHDACACQEVEHPICQPESPQSKGLRLKTAAALRAQDTAFLRKPQHSMDDPSESDTP